MNIFCDLHHGGLYNSLHLLLEKRLGHNLFRPIGWDWFNEGYWKVAEPYGNAPDTIGQFLGTDHVVWDQYKSLNGNYTVEDGVYYIFDTHYEYQQKAITFQKFKEMQIDIIISSYPGHDEAYDFLQMNYKPNAKRICQQGNQSQTSSGQNIMSSTTWIPSHPCNYINYHQEFNLDDFKFVNISKYNKVTSYINAMNSQPDYPIFSQLRSQMPDWEIKSYGGSCDDGSFSTERAIANEIIDSTFIWQVKSQGDGFGHIAHQAAACGRPMIVKSSYYAGQMPGKLINSDTCIDIDGLSPSEIESKIRFCSKPEILNMMSEAIKKRFDEEINFEEESKEVAKFLDNLI